MNTPERVAAIFQERFGRAPQGISRAPGRVNLLGEHVDYNDGFVLPIATDRATYVAFSPSPEPVSTLWAEDLQEGASFTSESLQAHQDSNGQPLPKWAHYPAGVAWSLTKAGIAVPALQAVFASDVPRGAGLSSSASVELAFALAWTSLGDSTASGMQLARLCQIAENEYVGVRCGIMDQAASACSEEGRLMLLDCRSLEYRTLPLPEGIAVVVADTGVHHSLAAGAYNDRRAACEQAVALLREHLPEIRALRDVAPEDFNRLSPKLPPGIEVRARHVVEEIERARKAEALLQNGDVQAFGALMNRSHASLRDLYEVSCPELETMTRVARSLPGCHGARLTGAGFGGCTVNLVEARDTNMFVEALGAVYERAFGRKAEIYVCRASRGAHLL